MADFILLRKLTADSRSRSSAAPENNSGGSGGSGGSAGSSTEDGGGSKKKKKKKKGGAGGGLLQRRRSSSSLGTTSHLPTRTRRHSSARTAFPFDNIAPTITTNGLPVAWKSHDSTGEQPTSPTVGGGGGGGVGEHEQTTALQFPLQSGDRVRVTGYGIGTVRFYGTNSLPPTAFDTPGTAMHCSSPSRCSTHLSQCVDISRLSSF